MRRCIAPTGRGASVGALLLFCNRDGTTMATDGRRPKLGLGSGSGKPPASAGLALDPGPCNTPDASTGGAILDVRPRGSRGVALGSLGSSTWPSLPQWLHKNRMGPKPRLWLGYCIPLTGRTTGEAKALKLAAEMLMAGEDGCDGFD